MSRLEDIISAAEADAALAPLSAYDHVVLAVSGGPDSVALLALVYDWMMRTPDARPAISVATVDHGLRPQSASEAAAVAALSAAFGLLHATLVWQGKKPQHGLPNAARDARYALLVEHARKLATPAHQRIAIVTAHTEDDQAETLFMRLARGGGVRALAAMSAKRALVDDNGRIVIDLVRPLLALPKRRLLATIAARGLAYAEDPTNTDPAYERPRIRAALAASGLASSALAKTAARMQSAKEVIDYAKRALAAAAHLQCNGGIFASCDRAAFDAAPSFLRQEFLRDLIVAFGGTTPPPQTSEIERLVAELADAGECRATLGGAVVSAGSSHIRIWREPGRMAREPLTLMPGDSIIWDDRFRLALATSAAAPLVVRPLGTEAYQAIARMIPKRGSLPAAAAHGLPAFFAADVLLAVPALGFTQSATETGILCKPLPALKGLEFGA